MTDTHKNRRSFLKQSAVGTGTIALGAFGAPAKRVLGANDRIRIAQIGCGGRGIHWIAKQVHSFKDKENVEVVAISDPWKRNLASASNTIKEWFGSKPKASTKHADILAMDDIDAVGIATPDHLHSLILANAAKAKKDVYCEKPMANNLRDARDAWHSVRDNNVVCQIGTQRRSSGMHMAGAELIQSGILGKISEVETAWHDASPRWMKPDYQAITEKEVDWDEFRLGLPKREFDPMRFRCWHLWKEYTVGTPGLLGSHLVDIATWFMDDPLPVSAVAHGGVYVWKDGREHADTLDCIIEYPKGFIVNYSTRLGNKNPVPEAIFYGTRGTFDTSSWIASGSGGGNDAIKKPIKVKTKKGINHVQNWLQCIRTRKDPNAPIEVGYAHSVMGILCFKSWEFGTRYRYDHATESIFPG